MDRVPVCANACRAILCFVEKGLSVLGRDLVVSDLQPEDREILTSGIFHIQSERDPSGRVVIYLLNDMFLRGYKIEYMVRKTWHP